MMSTATTTRVKRYSAIVGITLALLVVFVIGVSKTSDDVEVPPEERICKPIKKTQEGIASWYDYALGYEDQKCTKDREPCYSQRADTCASRDYERGSILKVSYQNNHVVCLVNDYGPEESTGRIIDLSSHAFEKLAPLDRGLIDVTIEKVN